MSSALGGLGFARTDLAGKQLYAEEMKSKRGHKRLKELRVTENTQLKTMLANAEPLDKANVQELGEGTSKRRTTPQSRCGSAGSYSGFASGRACRG